MKDGNLERNILGFFAGLSLVLVLGTCAMGPPANATDRKPQQKQSQDQWQHQGQSQTQQQVASANASVSTAATAMGGQAVNDGNSLSVSSEQAGDIILVPNNNTEKCLRVIGISFGNTDGGGGIGWPYRSQQCDLEAAADDAFAQGDRELGWMLKCKQKNIRKAFGGKTWKQDGERLCLESALGQVRLEDRLSQLQDEHTALLAKREAEASQCTELVQRGGEALRKCQDRLQGVEGAPK